MAGQRFEGRNLEEALTKAAESFGAPRFQIEYHVMVEKRGFLGGLKRVVIEAEVNPEKEAPPPVAPPRPAPRAREAHDRGPRERGPREARGGRDGRGRRPNRDEDRDPPRERRPRRESMVEEVPPQQEQSESAQRVAAWSRELFELAEFEVEIRTTETDDAIAVRIYGADSDRFTERGGELLDAAQTLATKSLIAKGIEKRVEFDARDFIVHRSSDLEQDARSAADRVRGEGREELLPPMSPVERRIVHLALQDDPDVATVSRGDGFYKRVAIVPRHELDERGPAEREP